MRKSKRRKVERMKKRNLILGVFVAIGIILGTGILLVAALKYKNEKELEKHFNRTEIRIWNYDSVPGLCYSCTPNSYGPISGGCSSFPGFFGYAIVQYSIFCYSCNTSEGNVTFYISNTPKDLWCSDNVATSIQIAISHYGAIGSVKQGYYSVSNPLNWYWSLPQSSIYLNFMVFLSIFLAADFAFIIISCALRAKPTSGSFASASLNYVY